MINPMDLAKTLEGLSAAADKEADDIRYYSGGSDYNASLAKFHNALVEAYRTGQLIVAQAGDVEAWQDIATAPMDGTPLLLFARSKNATASAPVIGWYDRDLGWIECAFHPNNPVGIVPSLWQPRPMFPAPNEPEHVA